MKWNKRILSLVLALLLLAGCGNGQLSATDDTAASTAGDTTAETTEHISPTDETIRHTGTSWNDIETDFNAAVRCQYVPETVANPDGLPVLKWVCLMKNYDSSGNRTWNGQAVEELNHMLADRQMPYRVQFVILSVVDAPVIRARDWLRFPDAQEALKDADLIYGEMSPDMIVDILRPITEYVTGSAEPSLKNAVAHEVNWLPGTVGDEIYGMCTHAANVGSCNAWWVDPAIMAAAGLTEQDFQREYWEMDEVFAKIYAANGNKPFMNYYNSGFGGMVGDIYGMPNERRPTAMTSLSPAFYDEIGSCFYIDYSGDMPVVVNGVETDQIRKIQEAALRYMAAGYTAKAPQGPSSAVPEALVSYYSTTRASQAYRESRDEVIIPVSEAYLGSTMAGGPISGVAAVSQHIQEAVSLLHLIGADEEFRMQLFYGKEGRDYKLEDGYYTLITQEDGSDYSMDFISPLAYFSGFTSNDERSQYRCPGLYNAHLVAEEGKTALQTYRDTIDSCVRCYPVVFDYTGLEQELEALEVLFEKYFRNFCSADMTKERYDQMLQAMKAAGSDKILAELQRQLTEWQKNNPDWQLKPEK